MSEAPKELWADWDYEAIDGVCGVHIAKRYASYCEPDLPPIQYVRADLIDEKREWVGLTQEELQDLCVKSYQTDNAGETHFARGHFADAIEAKLKEKNA